VRKQRQQSQSQSQQPEEDEEAQQQWNDDYQTNTEEDQQLMMARGDGKHRADIDIGASTRRLTNKSLSEYEFLVDVDTAVAVTGCSDIGDSKSWRAAAAGATATAATATASIRGGTRRMAVPALELLRLNQRHVLPFEGETKLGGGGGSGSGGGETATHMRLEDGIRCRYSDPLTKVSE
jgi:hypothetical protein